MQLSSDQQRVVKDLFEWLATNNRPQYITVGGYAGTGKTTLIAQLRQFMYKQNKKISVAFCAYTGKAARVLNQKLKESKSVYKDDTVGTIHSLIYSPILDSAKEEVVGWERRDELEYNLIIVDEASMVDENIWEDLKGFKLPIIAVGDHGQLPPIRGSLNLMEHPDLTLTEIHRQAKDNPIIKLSLLARKEGRIPPQKFSSAVRKLGRQDIDAQEIIGDILNNYTDDTMVLCGYNNTRVQLNQNIRQAKEFFNPQPQPGDRVICLKNNHTKQIFNGMLGTIKSTDSLNSEEDEWLKATIAMDDETKEFKGLVYLPQFNSTQTSSLKKQDKGDLFDFGYAMTVHKAQGSQSKRVVLFEERFSRMTDDEWRRWLYTGVTRAEEELYVLGD